MVEEIYKMKNDILKQIKKEIEERGIERIDVNRTGEMVDMVKDLAEAEKSCWEAQYYRSAVSNAMENKYGYTSGSGNQNQGSGGRMGYPMNYGGGTGSSARMGYDGNMGYGSMGYDGGNIIEELKRTVMASNQEDRMRLKNEINSIIGSI